MPNARGFVTTKDMDVHPLRLLWNYSVGGVCRWLPPCTLKNWILDKCLGVNFGPKRNASLNLDVIIDPWRPDLIHVGDDVFTGWGVRLLSHRIVSNDGQLSFQYGPIIIGEGAFIGGWATVEGDVEIGAKARIGSFSLVPWGKKIAAGCTARAPGVVATVVD